MNKRELKVCFVGVGSIGKRHINNLRIACKSRDINVTIDALRIIDPYNSDKVELNRIFNTVEDLPNDYDIIFITNPTNIHIETLRLVHEKGKHFFIEKPIVSFDNITEADTFPYREDSIYYIACPMRYERIMQYVKNSLDLHTVHSIRCICSSYLPDWRPGIDYRKCYSARKEMGGGVSIDLIHEWDYLTWLCGFPQSVSVMMGNKSKLEINSEDCAIYLAEYEHFFVELHLDYFGRKTIREMQIMTSEDTIICDFIDGIIRFLKTGETIDLNEERDEYQTSEINHFLDIVFGFSINDNSPKHACRVLRLTQGIII